MTTSPPDRRFHAANGRVAHARLRGDVEASAFVQGDIARVCVPVADLCRSPNGPRDKQLLHGQPVCVLERHAGWAFVQDVVDDYVGYVPQASVGQIAQPTHRIGAPLAPIYSAPDIKSAETGFLSFFSEVALTDDGGAFLQLSGGGYIARTHIVPFRWYAEDMASVAEMFLGRPYLWGGNSGLGLDCSGLIQLACHARGYSCPRDSDLQEASLGRAVAPDAPLRRGDLIFWKGHVGILRDAETLLHANAYHMAVAQEPLQTAIDRIGLKEFGAVTAIKRMGDTDE